MSAAEEQDPSSYTRLHISPLDAGLLPVVLSSAILPKARNISYHTIATFPEKRYGFVELPAEDATKLRKKLNGATLKGLKLKVDVAKAEKIPEPLGEAAMAGDKVEKKKEKKALKEDKAKKRKREAEEIPGIELHDGRKVKRGWTVADEPKLRREKKEKAKKGEKKEKRREARSKYTDHSECLVKQLIPTKIVDDGIADEEGKRKKKRNKTERVVVHEFAKTTKFPTFLKDTASSTDPKKELEFVDGKGWVDEEGNVVETVKTRPQPVKPTWVTPAKKTDSKSVPEKKDEVADKEDRTSDESESEADEKSEGEDNDEDEDNEAAAAVSAAEDTKMETKITADSLAPITKADDDLMSPPPKPTIVPTSILKSSPARPPSSSSAKGLSIKVPPATPGKTEVHPLEALYKRNKQADGDAAEGADQEAQPFSFFGGSGDIEEEDTVGPALQVPMTPFSRMDFEHRGIRSAAPTPDTAHPNRAHRTWPPNDDEEEDDDEDDEEELAGPDDQDHEMQDADQAGGLGEGAAVEGKDEASSDFQKWFWEHRGDLNRSWKRRRKTAAKEKRYRENRARAERAI